MSKSLEPILEPVKKEHKKPKRLTIKQRKWIVEYLKTGNASRAAMKVYDCKDMVSAGAIGGENLQNLKNPVKQLMEAKGLGTGRLLEVLGEGLKADRVISAINTGKEATGATSDFIEVADHKTRHRYLETAGKWLGLDKEGAKTALGVQVNQEGIKVVFTREE